MNEQQILLQQYYFLAQNLLKRDTTCKLLINLQSIFFQKNKIYK